MPKTGKFASKRIPIKGSGSKRVPFTADKVGKRRSMKGRRDTGKRK